MTFKILPLLSLFAIGALVPSGGCSEEPNDTAAPDLGVAADLLPGPDLALPPDLLPLPDILVALRRTPGVSVEEKTTTIAGYRFFQIQFDQPADHKRPEGLRFKQRVTLLHRGYDAPMVLLLSGYGSGTWNSPGRAELTTALAANQLEVEHRFFPPSRPEPPDYGLLTIEQSAADHHRLVEALHPLYAGKWASTGASKGGMTAVYHRRFYPNDLDATVPYVAPHSLGSPDPRYVPFVASAGTDPTCRTRLRQFQRQALSRRAEMLMKMAASGTAFNQLGPDKALEHSVLELPFGFWQYQTQSRCATIPADGAPLADVWKFMTDVAQIGSYGDGSVGYFVPYYYQAARQLGDPAIDEENVKDLLKHPGTDRPSSYLPAGLKTTYEPAAMPDISTWLQSQGKTLLFVYGQNDPWTAGAFELGMAQDSYRFVVKGGNHGSKIRDLATADRDEALRILGRWMGVTPGMMLQGLRPAGEEIYDPGLTPWGRPRL